MIHPALTLVLASLAPGVGTQEPVPTDQEVPVETRSFSIPETRLVRARFDNAEAHLAAQRYGEAIAELQRILDEHQGELLAAERPTNELGHVSDQPVNAGAASRARAVLFGFPDEARALYVQRYEADAARTLDAARAANDRRALAEVGRRWPITKSAERAWWSLGDLELEAGRERDALFAWARAIAARSQDPRAAPRDEAGWRALARRTAGTDADASLAPLAGRIDRALQLARSALEAPGIASVASALAPSGGPSSGPPPGADSDAWPEAYHLPWHPLKRESRSDGLFAARSGDRLFVSTGLRLLALSAFGGRLVWDSGEPDGWADLSERDRGERFLGIDTNEQMLAPASDGDVVIAALQMPWIRLQSDDYQKIKITVPIAERRLYAFDAATGRPLWNHAPPLSWNGETGKLEERMICAGPPVIVGSRIVAPLVRMQGRIDFQVGCFDLRSGERLWSTELISGQRPLNMFGRAEKEFASPPVCIAGDKVVVLTQLGAIAALDLFSGEILWETLYDQIALPKTQNFRASVREEPWRNCPPLVSDGVVLAVPFDSRALVALDLETGGMLWSKEQRILGSDSRGGPRGSVGMARDLDLLLGVSGRTIFLGGDRIVAFEAPAGLRASPQQLVLRWGWPRDEETRFRSGRPVLCSDRIVVPLDTERVELDLEGGRELARIPWPTGEGGGNLLVSPGELFALSATSVLGVFEWTALLTRARDASRTAPDDPNRALELAHLLAGRAAVDWGHGLGEAARARYGEAQAALERALARGSTEARPALGAELARCLRGLAQVKAGLGDPRDALVDLRRARALAGGAEVRETLLEELALLREITGPARASEMLLALDELERMAGSETIECAVARSDSDGGDARLVPLAAGSDSDGRSVVTLPLGLWTLVERAALHASTGNTAAEFVDLHAVIERWPDVEMPGGTASALAAQRIVTLLRAGRREGYAPFETRAKSELDAASARRDRSALERIARHFPGSEAARAADTVRLELAREAGDVAAVAWIVANDLAREGSTARASENEARALLHLASVATRVGNRELGAEMLRALADAQPDLVPSSSDFEARPLRELAAAAPRFERARLAPEQGRFGPDLTTLAAWPGTFEILGTVPRDTALSETPALLAHELVLAENLTDAQRQSAHVRLLSSDDPTTPRWTVELPAQSLPLRVGPQIWARRAAFAPRRVFLALRGELLAIDTTNGETAWHFEPEGTVDTLSVAASSGVVLLTVTPRGAAERAATLAFDAQSGALLWRAALADQSLQRTPILSEREAVYVPTSGNSRVVVRDLFTGRVSARFDLPTGASGGIDQEAWIEDGLLVVPWFDEGRNPERNHIVALDLVGGALRWRIAFAEGGGQRMLTGILQQRDTTWILTGEPARDDLTVPTPEMFELTTSIGALTPVQDARLSFEDQIVGLPRHTRVHLSEGPILILTPRAGSTGPTREARLRALDPRRGELWVTALGKSFDDVRSGGSVQAAISDSTIALALPLYDAKLKASQRFRSLLQTFDVRRGLFHGSREMQLEKGEAPLLEAFGDVLFLRRNDKLMEVLR